VVFLNLSFAISKCRQYSMEQAAAALVTATLKDKEAQVEEDINDSYDTSDDEG